MVLHSSCTAASTPSCQTLPHAEAWATLDSLTIWLPGALRTHTHQLEKGYLVLLLAGCLPGTKRGTEWKYEWKSWLLATPPHPHLCSTSNINHHNHHSVPVFQIWPSYFQKVTLPFFLFPPRFFSNNKSAHMEQKLIFTSGPLEEVWFFKNANLNISNELPWAPVLLFN